MIVTDLNELEGKEYPARRVTRNLVGGASPIKAANFCMGYVVLEPAGGQVPWHSHEQEEVYFILDGTGEMCVGQERRVVAAGQAVHIPPAVYHQLTNISEDPLTMLYCYGPAGETEFPQQELDGTLPVAGVNAPPLPDGARPQCISKAEWGG